MSFAQSDALFPAAELREMISSNFEAQCRVLCFGPFPSWDQMQARLEQVRHLLRPETPPMKWSSPIAHPIQNLDLALHSLGWKAFQGLCVSILKGILGQTVPFLLPVTLFQPGDYMD